jgi:hypothetical protein
MATGAGTVAVSQQPAHSRGLTAHLVLAVLWARPANSLKATNAGKLMAGNFLKLRTMASIVSLGERPNVPSLLRVICAAEEFRGATLRRCVCVRVCVWGGGGAGAGGPCACL